MANLPADIINQSFDAVAVDVVLGDLNDPTKEAQVSMRAYAQCRRQLLRAAHWDFARKTAPLFLLADASGATPNVGTLVPQPWLYEYAYPTDCLKVRFIPWNNFPQGTPAPPGNIAIATTPLTSVSSTPPFNNVKTRRAKFVISTDYNYPVQIVPGTEWWETPGVSPTGRTVILTNVYNAQAIYTEDMIYPNMWDPQFRAALVAYIASEIALSLSKEKLPVKLQLRNEQIKIAKEKIAQARITDGNEGTYTNDISVDWMRIRYGGAGRGFNWGEGYGGGPGGFGYGWDQCGFADGSAF